MLTLYRRHKPTCSHAAEGRAFHHCKCPIWVDGVLAGKEVRLSLRLRDWTKASREVIRMEASGNVEDKEAPVTLECAWKALLADLETRVSYETVRKYKTLQSQMTAWGNARGLTALAQFDLDTLSQFRQGWKDSPRTASKKVERLRALFSFALARKWIVENPAASMKTPKVSICPTMPFSSDEFLKILTACEGLQVAPKLCSRLTAHRLKTLILLMRYTGMRISDAVTFTTDRLDGNRLFLYTAKTGTPVYTVLPDLVLKALAETPRITDTRYFWSGNGKKQTAICDWQEKMKKAFDLAGISKGMGNAVSHRLRDTFAVGLLMAGVPIERVAVLLGHQSVRVTEKHYNPWVRSRQEQLEADVRNAWANEPPIIEGTKQVQTPNTRVM
jgi:integrase/recombinase XerD